MKSKFFVFILFVFLIAVNSSGTNEIVIGQALQIDKTPTIKPNKLIEQLHKKKKDNPNISSKELADYGNEIAKTQGIDFTFENCKLARQYEKTLGTNPSSKRSYDNKLKDLVGKEMDFKIAGGENDFLHPCFCVIDIPILKVNDRAMTIIADGKPFEAARPEEFYTEEFVLVDKTLKKSIRTWSTPIDATPFGISEDGKKIYYEFDFGDNEYESELQINDLVTEISERGEIKLVARDDAGIIKGKELKGYPTYSEISYRKFTRGGKSYIVKFSYPCT